MALKKVDTRNIILALIVVLMTVFRLFTLRYQTWSNFTPVGAVAIFSGVYFSDKWKAYAIILLTFFVSDMLINHAYFRAWSVGNSYTFWNCVCFSQVVFIGALIKKINWISTVIILLAPVTIHWLIMDMPWVNSPALYSSTFNGYMASLYAAIPFEIPMLKGDALFGLILFGGFELAKTRFTVLRDHKRLAV